MTRDRETQKETPALTVRDTRVSRRSEGADALVPYLVVLSGDDRGRRYPLDRQVNVLGRDPQVDLPINDIKISRIHAAIVVFPDRIVLEDRGSTNGTFVDGRRIDKAPIGVRSRIRIGNSLLRIDYKDPTELEFEQALYDAATTDALTGARNRTAFARDARQQVSLCRRNGLDLTVGMCDADHFKQVNDRYGHPGGDFVLQELARVVRGEIRDEDLFARYGGEEFVLALPRIGAVAARECFERIRKAIEDHEFRYEGRTIAVTVSIGICTRRGGDMRSVDELVEIADRALYRAKRAGRNRVETG